MSKGDATRERIVAEAAPIFNQRGYAGCSMHALMEATGLEKGGIYRHFSSKEELAMEAFRYAWRKVLEVRSVEDATISGSIPKLLHRVHQFTRVPSPIAGGCPLMNTAIDADDTSPGLRELARQAMQSWKDKLSSIVEAGVQAGEIRPDVQPLRIANAIVSALEGALMISRLEGTRQAMLDAEETLKALIEALAMPPSTDWRRGSSSRTEPSPASKVRARVRSAKQAPPVLNL